MNIYPELWFYQKKIISYTQYFKNITEITSKSIKDTINQFIYPKNTFISIILNEKQLTKLNKYLR